MKPRERKTTIGRRRALVPGLLAVALLTAGFVLALLPLQPPPAATDDAPPAAFSASRAQSIVETIARAPRPPGSAEHRRVRQVLVEHLERLHMEVEVQPAIAVRPGRLDDRVAVVHNVLGRLAGGTRDAGSVLLLAHYDSVPTGPGAADDAAGIAVALEVLRALSSSPPLDRDVIALFSDAEEVGLLGARAFLEHPWARSVDVVVNLEARGVRGPSLLFETTGGLGVSALRDAAAAMPRVVASSYSEDVYRRLPNDTDLTVFREAGVAGFNFALIEGFEAYHTPRDTPELLSPDSLQHHGENALGLARRLAAGGIDPAAANEGALVYFNLAGIGLVVYRHIWHFVLLAALLPGLAFAVVRARRSGRLSWPGMLLGLAAPPAALLLASAATALAEGAVRAAVGLEAPMLGDGNGYRLGWAAVAVGLSLLALSPLRRRPLGATLGAALFVAVAALAVTLVLPSTSFLFVWPAVSAAALVAAPPPAAPRSAPVAALAALPSLVLWVPVLVLVGAAFAPTAMPLLPVLAACAASSVAPQFLATAAGRKAWLVPCFVVAAGLTIAGFAAAAAGYDADRPRADSLLYALDSDTGRAVWATNDPTSDPWVAGFVPASAEWDPLPGFFHREASNLRQARAPRLDVAAPHLELLSREVIADRQRVRARLQSPRRAAAMRVAVSTSGTLGALSLDGKMARRAEDPPAGEWSAMLYGLPPDGLELQIEASADHPLTVTLVDRSFGLPRIERPSTTVRPPGYEPARGVVSDVVLVKKSFAIPPPGDSRGP